MAPIIPALNDMELDRIVAAVAAAKAVSAGYVLLRLPLEIKELFEEWLAQHYPGRQKHVLSLIRQMRAGRDYDSEWGRRMTGQGPVAEMMSQRFSIITRKLGLHGRWDGLDVSQFRVPPKAGDQLALF